MIVVDASVAVKWFATESDHDTALALLGSQDRLLAPDLVVAESLHALRRKLRVGDVTEEQYLRAGSDLPTFFDEIVPSSSVAPEACRLSIRLDHGIYDCVYLALALTRGATFVTADEAFGRKIAVSDIGSATRLGDWPFPDSGRLLISEDLVESVGRLTERVTSTFRSLEAPYRTDERLQIFSSSIYRAAFDSPAYRHLERLILDLAAPERAQIIALGWYGRDYEHGEFSRLVDNARRMFAERPETDLPYIVSVMGTVRAGFEKLRNSYGAESKPE